VRPKQFDGIGGDVALSDDSSEGFIVAFALEGSEVRPGDKKGDVVGVSCTSGTINGDGFHVGIRVSSIRVAGVVGAADGASVKNGMVGEEVSTSRLGPSDGFTESFSDGTTAGNLDGNLDGMGDNIKLGL
jgi:hypothetical protein